MTRDETIKFLQVSQKQLQQQQVEIQKQIDLAENLIKLLREKHEGS